jgi:hypothetical protein
MKENYATERVLIDMCVLQVPLFISEGDEIRVDTRDGKYVGKA